MAQLTLLILLGLAAWLGMRVFTEEKAKFNQRMREPDRPKPREITNLKRDPKTGVYRPADED